jgi:hypothetical protein
VPQEIIDYFGKETLDVKLTLHNQIMHYGAIIGQLFILNIDFCLNTEIMTVNMPPL